MKKNEMKVHELYSLEHTMAKPLLEEHEYPWEALPHIGDFIRKLGESCQRVNMTTPRTGSGFTRRPEWRLQRELWHRLSSARLLRFAIVPLSGEKS